MSMKRSLKEASLVVKADRQPVMSHVCHFLEDLLVAVRLTALVWKKADLHSTLRLSYFSWWADLQTDGDVLYPCSLKMYWALRWL